MPTILRNLRMLRLEVSSFIESSIVLVELELDHESSMVLMAYRLNPVEPFIAR